MRESSLPLDKALTTGLIPVTGNNLAGLYSCKNARPNGVGMEYVQPYSSYLDLVGEYPFPQLMAADKFAYVANATGLFEIVSGELVLKKSQNATSHYDLVDFKDSVCITGNGYTLFRAPSGTLNAVVDVPEASCACAIDGLLLLGNISSWTQSADADESTVAWAARPLSTEFKLHNDGVPTGAGYIKLFCGTVLRIFYADKKVIVFGTKGISILSYVSSPVPTLAVDVEIKINILYRESIAYSDEGFVLIDAFGFAFAFALRETQPKRLGFVRFFKGKRVVASYDCDQKEIMFCNGFDTLIIGQYGAGSRAQVITSGGYISGQFQPVVLSTSTEDMELVVDKQNMGVAGFKTIYGTGVDYDTDGKVYVNDSPVNSLGVATKVQSADNFMPKITIKNLTQATITGAELRWKLTDKRMVRGRYDNQTTA